MNNDLSLGLQVDVEDSEPVSTNSAVTSKRKAEYDPLTLVKRKNNTRKNVLKGKKSHQVRAILKTDPFKFCQDVGLLAKSVKCICNEDMKMKALNEKHMWKCKKGKHFASLSIRKGTWFENSKLSVPDILWIAYMWLYEYSLRSMMHECDHSFTTLTEWCTGCLDLCREILELKCDPLGGEEKTVELFECNFKKGAKTSKGGSERWVFCALEHNSTKSLLVIMNDKSSESIMKILDKYILPGTNLVSYMWSSYKNLTDVNFEYLAKERNLRFYNMWFNAQMDTFKQFSNGANKQVAGACTWSKAEYGMEFFEKMYRKSLAFAPDAYLAFLKDVAMVYKPCDVYIKKEPNATSCDIDTEKEPNATSCDVDIQKKPNTTACVVYIENISNATPCDVEELNATL